MSSVFRTLLLEDRQEGGGTSKRRQQWARTAARRGWQEPRQRYEESKGLDGVEDNAKDFSHETRKCGFRAVALSGTMIRIMHLTQ